MERPWRLADTTAELLGMETAAARIRSWDMPNIPGLLQAPEYARLLIKGLDPDISPAQLDADVELRMERQVRVFAQPLREAVFMIDELALTRMPCRIPIRRGQISRLLSPPKGVAIQVVPFSVGPHPALGSYVIYDFVDELIRKGVYVDGSVTAKGMVVTGKEVAIYEKVWGWLQEKALSPQQTADFLHAKVKRIPKVEK